MSKTETVPLIMEKNSKTVPSKLAATHPNRGYKKIEVILSLDIPKFRVQKTVGPCQTTHWNLQK